MSNPLEMLFSAVTGPFGGVCFDYGDTEVSIPFNGGTNHQNIQEFQVLWNGKEIRVSRLGKSNKKRSRIRKKEK